MRLFFCTMLLVCALHAQTKSATSNRPKFDTDLVRVLLANSEPGQKSRPHKHDVNRVMVYLDAGAQQLKFTDGTVKDQKWKAGDVLFDPAGGMHTSENKASKPFRIVEIELKKPGAPVKFPALDPVKVDPSHYRVVLENDQVRVVRMLFAAADHVPLHEHLLPRVVVFLTDYHLSVTGTDGQVAELKGAAGDITLGGVAKHAERSHRGRLTEIIAVEVKAAASK